MNVIITGQNGYIARKLYAYLQNHRHDVSFLDMRQDAWRHSDFSGADCIVHLAGIVHNSSKDPLEFQRVNVDLTAALARKAIDENVPQFIFISSMAVFGKGDEFLPLNEITDQTPLIPQTIYGKSKLSAEAEVAKIYGERACIVRPPMVYGENCTGNYGRLRNLVLRYKVVPCFENRRGMIYVYNLCELLRLLIESSGSGVFHPQDAKLLPTHEISRLIGAENDINVHVLRIPFLKLGAALLPDLKKAFGSLSYASSMTQCPAGNYRIFDARKAIAQTEKYWSV